MKTFLNVLYRRILYKIPLKLLLVLLAVFGILFACFSNAESGDVVKLGNTKASPTVINVPTDNRYNLQNYMYNGLFDYQRDVINPSGVYEINVDDSVLFTCIQTNENNVGQYSLDNSNWYNTWNNEIGCIEDKTFYLRNGSIKLFYFFEGDGYIPNQYNSLQCQTEYNLIPISSVDQNYCTTNNLCPSCPSCPVGTGGYSQLYINNILHLGAPNIIMNIPDEIDWDYAYTNSGQNMNIDVVGYNVDYEKIDSIVQFQNYKPTSEDFQKIIGLLAPYTKIIVFFVFLFIVWAWIKKPFKSKKL